MGKNNASAKILSLRVFQIKTRLEEDSKEACITDIGCS